jgi:hypothetical protein
MRKLDKSRCGGNICVKITEKQQFHVGALGLLRRGAR